MFIVQFIVAAFLHISSEILFKLYLVDFALVIADKAVELSVCINMTESFLSIIRSANQIVISSFMLLEKPLMLVNEVLKVWDSSI